MMVTPKAQITKTKKDMTYSTKGRIFYDKLKILPAHTMNCTTWTMRKLRRPRSIPIANAKLEFGLYSIFTLNWRTLSPKSRWRPRPRTWGLGPMRRWFMRLWGCMSPAMLEGLMERTKPAESNFEGILIGSYLCLRDMGYFMGAGCSGR